MSPDLFRQIVERRPAAPASRLSALPVSIVVHVLVVLVIVVIPLLANDVLPAVTGGGVLQMPLVVVPSPPPPPLPAARRHAMLADAAASVPPAEAPVGIGRETRLPSEVPLDVPAPHGGGDVPGADLPPEFNTVIADTPPPTRSVAPVRVSSLIKTPVKLRDVSPVYPEAAILARVDGVVVIEAVIGVTGEVREARVLRSKPLLDEAALAAVRQWKYTPTLLNGVPVPLIMTVTVRFALR